MTTQAFLHTIRELIGKSDVKSALIQLRQLLKNSPQLDDALLQSARFNSLLNDIKLGVLDYETASVTKTKISKGILDMVREIEEQKSEPAIQAEIENALRLTEEIDEYGRIKEKILLNRGAGTSELLKDKRANDLDEKAVNRLFQTERVVRLFADERLITQETTLQKQLVALSLAENGHIFKGTFLCLGKRNQIQTICPAASPSQFIIFRGTNRTHIFQLESLEGHITQQYEEMMRLLRKNVPLGRSREKDEDVYEIPMTAISEFIANAYVHRDYDYGVQSYIQVEMYDDRIEIKSPGHLPTSVDVNNIQGTVLTNPTIAAVFHLNGYIERAGTGINVAQRILIEQGLERATIENIDSPKMVKVTIKRQFNPSNSAIKVAKHLGTPPFLPDFLLGEDAAVAELNFKLTNENNALLLLTGVGGSGKTTLAALYYHRFTEKYAHLAWISAKTSLLDGFLSLAQPLGLTFSSTTPSHEQLSIVLNNLRQLSKPSLLIIDDIDNLDDLKKHYAALRSCPNLHILLVSRFAAFEQIPVYTVGKFSLENAIALFKNYYPKHKDSENGLLQKIVEAVDNNVLVIAIMAKNMAQLNRFKTQYTLSELLSDLGQKGLFSLKTKDIQTDYHAKNGELRSTKIGNIVDSMYDFDTLSPIEKKVLKTIADLSTEPIEFEKLEKILMDVEGMDDILLNLAEKGWLLYNESETTFKIQPIISIIMRHKASN